ncbi:MAG: CrcB family protein [Acidimicrobiia bacterium]
MTVAWTAVLAVLCGGLIGSMARVVLGQLIPIGHRGFPTPVLVVNLLGSFLLGAYMARREMSAGHPDWVRFWAIGVMGSFTTFSTFTVDLVRLVESGRPAMAAAYLGASVAGGLLLAIAGLRLGRFDRMTRRGRAGR